MGSLTFILYFMYLSLSYLVGAIVVGVFWYTGDFIVDLDDEGQGIPKSKRTRLLEAITYFWVWLFSPLLVLVAIGYFLYTWGAIYFSKHK